MPRRSVPVPAALALAWLAACAGGTGTTPAPSGSEPGAEPSHAVETQELRRTMHQLEAVRRMRLPQELDVDRQRELWSRDAARSARLLAEGAERIGRNPPPDLSPEERESFRRLAEALRTHAAAIAAGAGRMDPAELERRYAEIDATCDACHGRFQRGPGPLGSSPP